MENKKHNALELVGMLFIASTFLVGALANYQWSLGFALVTFLVIQPFLIQMIGLFNLRRKRNQADEIEQIGREVFLNFYVYVVCLSCVSVYVLWAVYGLNRFDGWEEGLSWAATFCILSLGLLIALMFWAGIKGTAAQATAQDGWLRKKLRRLEELLRLPEHFGFVTREKRETRRPWLDDLREGAVSEKGLVTLFFFTVFLSLAYLFAFAFAFHNKSTPLHSPGLYMRGFVPGESLPDKATNPALPTQAYSLEFADGRSRLEAESLDKTTWEARGGDKELAGRRYAHNQSSLTSITQCIRELLHKGQSVRLIITGQASELPTNKSSYQSN